MPKMPVPNSERSIKIHRDSNFNPTWPPSPQQETNQQETRRYSTQTVTKRYVSTEPQVTTSTAKSSDLFSNAHDRRGSSTPSPNFGNTSTTMKSSSLVRNAMGDHHDVGRANNETRRDSKTTTYTSQQVIPASTPELSIVPGGNKSPGGWAMGTDAGGDVPVTYEIVTKADGKKEFQLLITANQFSPEDLQVKLTDNTLNISGKHEERSPNGAYSQKSFYRSCTIPSGVRPEDLNCSLDSSGRLKITAPLPEEKHSTTKTITTTQHNNWHEAGVPSGFTIKPAGKEQVITVWNEGQDPKKSGNVTRKEERSSSRTVRTFKTVA